MLKKGLSTGAVLTGIVYINDTSKAICRKLVFNIMLEFESFTWSDKFFPSNSSLLYSTVSSFLKRTLSKNFQYVSKRLWKRYSGKSILYCPYFHLTTNTKIRALSNLQNVCPSDCLHYQKLHNKYVYDIPCL